MAAFSVFYYIWVKKVFGGILHRSSISISDEYIYYFQKIGFNKELQLNQI